MKFIPHGALALSLCLLAAAPAVAKPPTCSSLPPNIKEAMRDMSYCITAQNPVVDCGNTGIDVQVFGNNEGKLPNAGRGQQYWEGKIRKDDGAAGQRRLVYLVTTGKKKNVVEARYYSPDHYATFCQIN